MSNKYAIISSDNSNDQLEYCQGEAGLIDSPLHHEPVQGAHVGFDSRHDNDRARMSCTCHKKPNGYYDMEYRDYNLLKRFANLLNRLCSISKISRTNVNEVLMKPTAREAFEIFEPIYSTEKNVLTRISWKANVINYTARFQFFTTFMVVVTRIKSIHEEIMKDNDLHEKYNFVLKMLMEACERVLLFKDGKISPPKKSKKRGNSEDSSACRPKKSKKRGISEDSSASESEEQSEDSLSVEALYPLWTQYENSDNFDLDDLDDSDDSDDWDLSDLQLF